MSVFYSLVIREKEKKMLKVVFAGGPISKSFLFDLDKNGPSLPRPVDILERDKLSTLFRLFQSVSNLSTYSDLP